MGILRSAGFAFALPLLGSLGWTAYTSRGVRHVVVRDPLDVSPYCCAAVEKTIHSDAPSLMCAFEMPVVLPTAKMRRELEASTLDGSLYALHALLSCWFMRIEMTATAFTARWRISDAYACWVATSRSALAKERRLAFHKQQQQQSEGEKQEERGYGNNNNNSNSNDNNNSAEGGGPLAYGEWAALPAQRGKLGGRKESILTYGSEAIAVSLVPSVEGSRQAVLSVCCVVQPFDGFVKNSVAERVAVWAAEKCGKLLTAQVANALEKLERL